MKTFFKNLKDKYFRKELDFRARLFSMLALSGAIISFITVIQSLVNAMWSTALASAVLTVLSLGIMIYAERSGNYRRCYYITIVAIFLIFFPIVFFTSGGYHGGIPSMFIFATLFTMLMLEGWKAFLMMGIEIVEYVSISYFAYLHPETVSQFANEFDAFKDIQFAFITVSIFGGIVIFFHLREYETQRRQLNEKNEKLKQMDEAKSAFLNTVAHEVKNPLNIISLHAQDSSEILDESPVDTEQLKENQKIIGDTVIRIDRILNDLMDTVSIEEGRLSLTLAPIKLADVIRDSVQPWQKQYDTGKVKTDIRLNLDDSLPEISADYVRIRQLMENILSNSFRHTKNGRIVITLEACEDGQKVCVADNGEGMNAYMCENALKGYVSANKDYWRHGIGLYVCYRVVEAHGGKIWIESEKGKGASIYFTLPQKEEI